MAKPAKTKACCSGCHNDFYNGKNPHGVKECWCFPDAKLAKRKAVHINQRPPWTQKAQWKLDCYSQPQYVYVGEHVNA